MKTTEHNLKIIKISDHLPEMEKYLAENGERGLDVGFKCLREFYSHKKGSCTDWTGHASSGKTYFVLDILMRLSETYGLRHCLYVPDIGNYKEIFAKLIKMKTGKNFNDRWGNKATIEDVIAIQDWLQYHFLIMNREDLRTPVSPIDFWTYVCQYKDSDGKGVDTGFIDSWKNMYHDTEGKREDQYLDYILSYRNELAETYNKHFHTIAHSTKTEQLDGYVEDGEGGKKKKRRIPDAYDIKGGGSWFANGKSIITIDIENIKTCGANLYISKAKPEDVGKIGNVINKIYLDVNRGRFYETGDTQTEIPIEEPINNKCDDAPF